MLFPIARSTVLLATFRAVVNYNFIVIVLFQSKVALLTTKSNFELVYLISD